MVKPLSEMSYTDIVQEGVRLELNAVIQGRALQSRVRDVMELALRWASERRDAEKGN